MEWHGSFNQRRTSTFTILENLWCSYLTDRPWWNGINRRNWTTKCEWDCDTIPLMTSCFPVVNVMFGLLLQILQTIEADLGHVFRCSLIEGCLPWQYANLKVILHKLRTVPLFRFYRIRNYRLVIGAALLIWLHQKSLGWCDYLRWCLTVCYI